VALTRARRVLRVVGHLDFFKSLSTEDSVLRKLALFARERELVDENPVVNTAKWRRPTWKPGDTSFKPIIVAKFHDCLRKMKMDNWRDPIIAFNILLAVATPDINKLKARPRPQGAQWQTSSLKIADDVCITWIAKPIDKENLVDQSYVGCIEAHFAGTKADCNTFVQNHRVLPAFACEVKSDLSGVISSTVTETQGPVHSTKSDLRSW